MNWFKKIFKIYPNDWRVIWVEQKKINIHYNKRYDIVDDTFINACDGEYLLLYEIKYSKSRNEYKLFMNMEDFCKENSSYKEAIKQLNLFINNKNINNN